MYFFRTGLQNSLFILYLKKKKKSFSSPPLLHNSTQKMNQPASPSPPPSDSPPIEILQGEKKTCSEKSTPPSAFFLQLCDKLSADPDLFPSLYPLLSPILRSTKTIHADSQSLILSSFLLLPVPCILSEKNLLSILLPLLKSPQTRLSSLRLLSVILKYKKKEDWVEDKIVDAIKDIVEFLSSLDIHLICASIEFLAHIQGEEGQDRILLLRGIEKIVQVLHKWDELKVVCLWSLRILSRRLRLREEISLYCRDAVLCGLKQGPDAIREHSAGIVRTVCCTSQVDFDHWIWRRRFINDEFVSALMWLVDESTYPKAVIEQALGALWNLSIDGKAVILAIFLILFKMPRMPFFLVIEFCIKCVRS